MLKYFDKKGLLSDLYLPNNEKKRREKIMRKVIKKVIKNDEVGSVGEALADAALKESDHVQTTGQMKKVANDGKRAKKRNIMPPGSCVDPKDKRRGPVKSASDLQLEIANIFHHLEQEKLKKLLLNSPTNVVLSVVQNWNEIAGDFSRKNLIPAKELFDQKGKVRLKVSWVIKGMLEVHEKFMEQQYGKMVDEIPISKLRNNISSLMSRVFKSLVVLGIAKKDETIKTKGAPASCYVLSKKIEKMTLEQFHCVYRSGWQLHKRVEEGEFSKLKTKKRTLKKPAASKTSVSGDGKSATINLAKGVAIKAININATSEGGVSIEILFK